MIRLSGDSFAIPGVRVRTIESISVDYSKQLKQDPNLYKIEISEEANVWKVNFIPKDEAMADYCLSVSSNVAASSS